VFGERASVLGSQRGILNALVHERLTNDDAPPTQPAGRLTFRYNAPRGRSDTGNLLAKPNDGAYVSLSHLGRFRVIDPLSSSPQGGSTAETSGEN
jgi:hypothetical protein